MKISVFFDGNVFSPEGTTSEHMTLNNSRIISLQTNHIYFEKQVDRMCGLHVLNNLFGYHAFTRAYLDFVALELKAQYQNIDIGSELKQFEFSRDVGDYKRDVITNAVYGMEMVNVGRVHLRDVLPHNMMADFLLRQKRLFVHENSSEKNGSGHYFCLTYEHEHW